MSEFEEVMKVDSSKRGDASASNRRANFIWSFLGRSVRMFGRNTGDPQLPPPPRPRHPADYPQQPPQLHLADYPPPPHSNPFQNSNQYDQQISYRPTSDANRGFEQTYSKKADEYNTLQEVAATLVEAGLESFNLIVGIDFTKSNEWTGKRSFNRRSLHQISGDMNLYQQVISIIGRTLSSFDKDNLIPCFGFGDVSTHDQDVFSFYPDGRPCNGFRDALSRYMEIVPHVKLSGPTSFAPVIEMATRIVEKSGGEHHVLLIIADGQVTRSVETTSGHISPQERQTVDAIIRASQYALSIVLVGVGDGPWDTMKEFQDQIPERAFDNFQFVNFTEIMLGKTNYVRKEMEFALATLIEIPLQYKATRDLGILGRRIGESPKRFPLSPPTSSTFSLAQRIPKWMNSTSIEAAYTDLWNDNQMCPICFTNRKDMAFGCGHQTCCDCGPSLSICPICSSSIAKRIKLYF